MLRGLAVRLFELLAIFGPFVAVLLASYYAGYLIHILAPLLFGLFVATLIVLWFMPSSCRFLEGRLGLCTPVRCKRAELRELEGEVKGGRIPPGKTYALFCFGWRFPTTLFSDCGKEFFFSTPSCDGKWEKWRGTVDGKEKEIWICGCRR
ncbi:MAG: hypothetical protein QXS00_02990 [Pyrobaculum sp.]|uniref:Uncharacterized protein n=1 Tax=Pyrobaculum oguniense (strain DSM 13380 / JCM 10595 / TE7) TaxID=698757 RepID=H6Q7N4_PYROT|nr:hypothetical protein Pogu_0437 [Pyrobaculum oguniense TE7]